jgi:hypothetical protein
VGFFAYPREKYHSRKNTLNFEDVRERPMQPEELRLRNIEIAKVRSFAAQGRRQVFRQFRRRKT